jgi:hypothetical protein
MIGTGIDSDVTTAAIKAVRNSLDQNTLFDDFDTFCLQHQWKIRIQLGVPPSLNSTATSLVPYNNGSNASNSVVQQDQFHEVNETSLLQQLFPNCYRQQVLPTIEVEVGGLKIHGNMMERNVVIAYIEVMHQFSQSLTPTVLETSKNREEVAHRNLLPNQEWGPSDSALTVSKTACAYNLNESTKRHGFQTLPTLKNVTCTNGTLPISTYSMVAMTPNDVNTTSSKATSKIPVDQAFNRNDRRSLSSIDLLAQISAAIMDEKHHNHKNSSNKPKFHHDINPLRNSNGSSQFNDDERNHKLVSSNGTDYAKANKPTLRKMQLPFKTPKNHTRHFVRHSYQDYSHEMSITISDNENLGTGDDIPVSTASLAFPLKLHETLKQIENDKNDHIFGWLPHGRSFKIHQQQDFSAIILPQYFIMTKKSSFLRQLNLYGFRRISDGSYYHERFLRGMKSLCQSMQRQKVNGNGVRAAGNPDEEPNLSEYPPCPPSRLQYLNQTLVEHPILKPQFPVTEQAQSETICIRESSSSVEDDGVARSGNDSIDSTDEDNDCCDDDGGTVSSNASCTSAIETKRSSLADNPRQVTFPVKLQRILDELERDGETDILSWLPHGRAFQVHDIDRFVNEILPLHFNQSKYSSFQRQCHMYHFARFSTGPDKGAYYNHHLLRGRPDLAIQIYRTRVNGNGVRRPGNPSNEPNFYIIPPLPPIQS